MWARIAGCQGAIVSKNVKACYRAYDDSQTTRVWKTAESVQDLRRLNGIFAQRYPSFSLEIGRARASATAWGLYQKFKRAGEKSAATACWNEWVSLTPLKRRIAWRISHSAKPYFRKMVYGADLEG
jgi:hypothetical protein